ncbi:MAG: glycosyltransferase [Geobacteraceae bacterium]|nr:glycosyltransferase [Geobacteraceae bacterium]
MLKVVQVSWNWINESGGAAQSILNFSRVFNSTVISFTKKCGRPYLGSESTKQVHIPYNESAVNRYAYTRSHIKKQAEDLLVHADLIIIHGFYRYHFDWAVNIATKNKIPYWIIPHGSLDPFVFSYRTLAKKIWFIFRGNNGFASANRVVFATESERDKSNIPISPEKSIIVNWPVAPVNTECVSEAKMRVRSEHNIPIDAKVLLFIGRFHPMKRPIETINAVAGCNSDVVYLMMMGPDSDVLTAAECEKHCTNHGYKNICFIKPVYSQKKYEFYMAADAFISLSYRENFGYTVAEALSTGIPVILSPGNDLSKDVRLLNCGWLLLNDNLDDATKAIKAFIATPNKLLAEMGRRGQQWAHEELSFEMFNSKIRAAQLLKKS